MINRFHLFLFLAILSSGAFPQVPTRPIWKIVDTSMQDVCKLEADSLLGFDQQIVRCLNGRRQIVWPKKLTPEFDSIWQFGTRYKILDRGLYGIIDKQGKTVLPISYQSISILGNGWLVKQRDKFGLLDTNTKPILPHACDWIVYAPHSARLIFKRNDSVFYQSAHSSQSVCATEYDSISELSPNYTFLWKDKKAWLADNSLNLVSTTPFSCGSHGNEDLYTFLSQDSLYIYDVCTQTFCTQRMQPLKVLTDSSIWARVGSATGFYDLKNDRFHPLEADTFWLHPDFKNHLLVKRGDTLSLAHLNGQWFTNYQRNFRYIGSEINGYLPVKANRRFGFINAKGFLSISTQYDSVGTPYGGYFAVKIRKKWGMVDAQERIIIQPNYSKVGIMYQGKVAVWQNGLATLANDRGEELFTPRFHDIFPSNQSYWITRKGNLYGFLNSEAREVYTPRFERVEETDFGYFVVRQYGREGILNSRLEEVWPLKEKKICWVKGTDFFAVIVN
jgi:hypothetical protein